MNSEPVFFTGTFYLINGTRFRRLPLDDGYCHLLNDDGSLHWRRSTAGFWERLVENQWQTFEPDFSNIVNLYGEFCFDSERKNWI